MRPTDLAPQIMLDALLNVTKQNRNWIEWQRRDGNCYSIIPNEMPPFLEACIKQPSDYLGLKAMGCWLADGPKMFRPTPEQIAALENIDVNIPLTNYSQPYPALWVEVPIEPFLGVLCYNEPGEILVCSLMSRDHLNDINTTIGTLDGLIEDSLETFDPDCQDTAATAARCLRVACNSCLALSNWGHHLELLLPKEVERDRRLAGENSKRGQRARKRLQLAVKVARFDQEVKIHRTGRAESQPGGPTGHSMPTHWRRGHWAMQAHGPQHSLRKRILRPPVMVRADLFVGDPSETVTTYH